MEWIKHGWGKNYLDEPDNDRSYYIDISDITFSQGESLKHARLAIKKIKDRYPPPYYLAASGGVDSQAMIWAWHLSDQDFRVVSFRYENGFNDHDTTTLDIFCRLHGINYQMIEVSFLDLFDNEFPEWSKKYKCESPQMYVYTKFREYINGGTLILSGGMYPGLELTYTLLGLERYRLMNSSNYVPFFFLYTPELLGSFYYDYLDYGPLDRLEFQEWVGEERHFTQAQRYKRKVSVYQKSGYPVIAQDQKYSGFEQYKDYYDRTLKVSSVLRAKYASYSSKRLFDVWYRYRLMDDLILPLTLTVVSNEKVNI